MNKWIAEFELEDGDTMPEHMDLKYMGLKIDFRCRPKEDILNKIRAEILCHIIEDDTSGNVPARLRADWEAANKAHMIDIAILDKYKDREWR